MALSMNTSSIGVSASGMKQVRDEIKMNLIDESVQSIDKNVENLESNIDNYWHGAAADAFKMKVDSERAKVITILNVLEAKMELDLGAMATNSAIADAEIAEAIFGTMGGGSYSGGGGSFGCGLSGLSGGSMSPQNSASSSSPHNNADTAPRAQRSGNSSGDAVQNSGIYSDDQQKQSAASQALADSSTGSVYVIDDLGSLKGGVGVTAYDEQGNKTIFRISEDGVPHGHQLKEGLVYTISDPTELNPNSPFVKLDSDGGYAYARTNSDNPGPTVISINDSSLSVDDLDNPNSSGLSVDELARNSASRTPVTDTSANNTRISVQDMAGNSNSGLNVQDLGNNYSPNLTIDEMAKNIDVD